jgi:hypothetical protein
VLGEGNEWLDLDLPTPHYLHHDKHYYSYAIAWAITGFFGTTKSKEYLLDVVARFLLAFPDATRLPWSPEMRESGHIYDRDAYELNEIAECLPSLPWGHEDTKLASFVDSGIKKFNRGKKPENRMISEDALFEATRWHLYRRAYAENSTENITEDYVEILLDTENQLLAHPKSPADVRSKAKRMAQYMQNEFCIYEREGYREWSREKRNAYMREYKHRKGINMATVSEHLTKVHKNRNAKSKAKIKSVLEDMFIHKDIKFANGKYRIGAIAKLVDLTPETTSKHLKEMGII